jgi:hypothetical protein
LAFGGIIFAVKSGPEIQEGIWCASLFIDIVLLPNLPPFGITNDCQTGGRLEAADPGQDLGLKDQ